MPQLTDRPRRQEETVVGGRKVRQTWELVEEHDLPLETEIRERIVTVVDNYRHDLFLRRSGAGFDPRAGMADEILRAIRPYLKEVL